MTIRHYTTLYNVIQDYTTIYKAIPHCTTLYNVIHARLCDIMQDYILHYRRLLYKTINKTIQRYTDYTTLYNMHYMSFRCFPS
jgi:hypothetical protein